MGFMKNGFLLVIEGFQFCRGLPCFQDKTSSAAIGKGKTTEDYVEEPDQEVK